MSLLTGCPRCPAPVARTEVGWGCPEHGDIVPLRRPHRADYDSFTTHLTLSGGLATLLPWPETPRERWRVTDHAVVAAEDGARATLTCSSGETETDGEVHLWLVHEELGIGLGARVAGLRADDPGSELLADTTHGDATAPLLQVRYGSRRLRLWPVSTSATTGDWNRSVLVGEAEGRWIWVVARPATAVMMLTGLTLRDASDLGHALLELPFGEGAPPW